MSSLFTTNFESSVGTGTTEFRFPCKPSEAVRSALKANGFRWSPSSCMWWKRGTAGALGAAQAVDKIIDRENGVKPKPCGPCRRCGSPNGYIQGYGAQTHVQCDDCWAITLPALRASFGTSTQPAAEPYIDVDAMYEDDCARRCGL